MNDEKDLTHAEQLALAQRKLAALERASAIRRSYVAGNEKPKNNVIPLLSKLRRQKN